MEKSLIKINRSYKRKRSFKVEEEETDFDMNQFFLPKIDDKIQVQLAAESNHASTVNYNKRQLQSTTITTMNHDNLYMNETFSRNQMAQPLNGNFQLLILKQPEETHRARYLSEGSRGSIKDRSGFSHCTIQLLGYYRPTRVEIYASTGEGPIRPHDYYDLIQVLGKTANTLPSKKVKAHDGITCIEIMLRPENNMTAVLDCIGILKICSYDMKKRAAQRGAKDILQQYQQTNGSNTVRLIFRAYIDKGISNSMTIIQTESEPIICVQQLGIPEISKISLTHAPAHGGMDLFIIGRNFDRFASVVFREYKENGVLAWSAEGSIQKQFLHQCHIVCTVPAFHNIVEGGSVSVTVRCGNKMSHPSSFYYTPSINHSFTPYPSIKYHSSSGIYNNEVSSNVPTSFYNDTSYYSHNENKSRHTNKGKSTESNIKSYPINNEQRYDISENESFEPTQYNNQQNIFNNSLWITGNNNFEGNPNNVCQPFTNIRDGMYYNNNGTYLNYHTNLETHFNESGDLDKSYKSHHYNGTSNLGNEGKEQTNSNNQDSTQGSDLVLESL
uniref:RHD domain-containing protein n=1 Tax=Parastrongyloides trichosuri TaxID=131310 RepID=A0A0N4ZEW1_PARTI